MIYRFMRIILFFDLPSVTHEDLKNYRKFRNFLINEGFMQQQESVYTKLALNSSIVKAEISKIKKNAPAKGSIQVLTITEKEFASMEVIIGSKKTNQIDSDERLIVL